MDRRKHRAYYYPRPVRRGPHPGYESWGEFLTSFALAAVIIGGFGAVVYALTL